MKQTLRRDQCIDSIVVADKIAARNPSIIGYSDGSFLLTWLREEYGSMPVLVSHHHDDVDGSRDDDLFGHYEMQEAFSGACFYMQWFGADGVEKGQKIILEKQVGEKDIDFSIIAVKDGVALHWIGSRSKVVQKFDKNWNAVGGGYRGARRSSWWLGRYDKHGDWTAIYGLERPSIGALADGGFIAFYPDSVDRTIDTLGILRFNSSGDQTALCQGSDYLCYLSINATDDTPDLTNNTQKSSQRLLSNNEIIGITFGIIGCILVVLQFTRCILKASRKEIDASPAPALFIHPVSAEVNQTPSVMPPTGEVELNKTPRDTSLSEKGFFSNPPSSLNDLEFIDNTKAGFVKTQYQ